MWTIRNPEMVSWHSFIILITISLSVNCVMFNLLPNKRRCLTEELHGNMPFVGEYQVSDAPGQKVTYVIKDSEGEILGQRHDLTQGNFSYKIKHYDAYEICFISEVPSSVMGVSQEVSFVIKNAAETEKTL